MAENTFHCLSCNRINPIRGANYSNKYCNNQCQQDHRKRLLAEKRVADWLEGCGLYVWKEVPDYIRSYLINKRGHKCENCGIQEWNGYPAPLIAVQKNGDIYNNTENNLEIICHNCRSQK